MREILKKLFKMELVRDNNYYTGLCLLLVGIGSIFWYLKFDQFEPLSFLITFLIIGWGFVLLWKSDNDLRFEQAQLRIIALEAELQTQQCNCGSDHLQLPSRLHRYRTHRIR